MNCYCKELGFKCSACFDNEFPYYEPEKMNDWPYRDSEDRHRFEMSMEKPECTGKKETK